MSIKNAGIIPVDFFAALKNPINFNQEKIVLWKIMKICSHIANITELKQPTEYVCEECIKIGSDWVHLRACQTCGVTLCCDQSPNKHMTKHYHQTDHPVVISAEPGEKWLWCYKDKIFADYE